MPLCITMGVAACEYLSLPEESRHILFVGTLFIAMWFQEISPFTEVFHKNIYVFSPFCFA